MEFDAVVLAGGAGTRLGGADKAGLLLDGVPLLDRVLAACATARRTVVVGTPRTTTRAVEWTLEQPPGGGPLAGLAAGVAALNQTTPPEPQPVPEPDSAPVLVLATDLAQVTPSDVQRLIDALSESDCAAAVFVDESGQLQPLAGVYRRRELSAALAGLQPVAGGSMRSLLRALTLVEVPDLGASADIDTPGQLAAARRGDAMPSVEETLATWVEKVCAAMEIDPDAVDVDAVLDLAADAAHGIARPAAPLTTYLAGYLAGRSGTTAAEAIAQLTPLIPAPPGVHGAAREGQ